MGENTEKVLPSKSMGPHGLGDPEDQTLRKVEVDVKIAQKVRDKSRAMKCIPEVQGFNNCVKEHQFIFAFTCRQENDVMRKCLTKWFHDKDLWDECTKEYLQERTDYRRTGVPTRVYQRIPHKH